VFSKQYQNTHYSTFAEVLREFLKEAGVRDDAPPISACVACAGPVTNNTVKMTNRDGWVIAADEIKRVFRIREVSLINDFLAVGYGLMSLEKKEMVVLQVSCIPHDTAVILYVIDWCCGFRMPPRQRVHLLRVLVQGLDLASVS
jgi:glucokinase